MATPRLDVDFGDPAIAGNPFPLYDEIRAIGPVVRNATADGWMLAGYDTCLAVLTDSDRFVTVGGRRPEVTFWFDAPNMIIADGAEHRRLRQGVSRHFTMAAIERRWEPRVRGVVEEVLAPLAGTTSIDLAGDFARIPAVVLAEMLGVPAAWHDALRRWSRTIVGNVAFGHERPEGREAMDAAVAELNDFLTQEIVRHRRDQPDDLLTVMVNMPDWSEAEIRSSAVNLLVAGYDTTAKLMGECLVALELHPEQRRLVAGDLVLVPNAIEEVLRWRGPSQAVAREVAHDTVLAGTSLAAGDIVYLLLAAANRDPTRWARPDHFDVRREFRPHLGFGAGAHFCLSAPLARLETKIAVETLLRQAPDYRLADVAYGASFFGQGPERGMIHAGGPAPPARLGDRRQGSTR